MSSSSNENLKLNTESEDNLELHPMESQHSFEHALNKKESIAAFSCSCSCHKKPEKDKGEALQKIENNIILLVKTKMDQLEKHQDEYLCNYQKTLDNNFEVLNSKVKEKLDVLSAGDMSQVMKERHVEEPKNIEE